MPRKKTKSKGHKKKKQEKVGPNLLSKSLGYILYGIWLAIKHTSLFLIKTFRTFGEGCLYLFNWARISKGDKELPPKHKTKDLHPEKKIKKKKKIPDTVKKFLILESISGNIIKFENMLEKNKSSIGLILGARGQGKSALGMRILENIHHQTGRRCVAIGFEQEKLPDWIHVIDNTDNIPHDSMVLIDEGGILFSSRDSMSDTNKFLSQLLLIARHKDLSILFISQNSANLELNIIRQADYMLLKPSSLLQEDFERKKIQQIYKEVSGKFKRYKSFRGLTYIYSDLFRGFITNELPSFWNEDVSKAFKQK